MSRPNARSRRDVVQGRPFAHLLEQAVQRYQNRPFETAQVIEELIELAKDLGAAAARGESLGLSDDELAFYDALETNDSAVNAVKVLEMKRCERSHASWSARFV
jgi:type I restriction enzyme R subunit